MHRVLRFLATCLLCAAFSVAVLPAEEFTCPATLPVRQTAISLQNGWEAVPNNDPVHLDGVSIFYKHPRERGSQVPDKMDRTKVEESVTWNIVRAPGDEFWLGCEGVQKIV